MTYAERRDASRRLTILRSLCAETDGRLNESDLGRELDAFGHRCSRAEVRVLLDWLEAAGAVRLQRPGEVIVVAEVTARGADHVERRGEPIEGVALPGRA